MCENLSFNDGLSSTVFFIKYQKLQYSIFIKGLELQLKKLPFGRVADYITDATNCYDTMTVTSSKMGVSKAI